MVSMWCTDTYLQSKQTSVLKIQTDGDGEAQGLWGRSFGNNNGSVCVWASGVSMVTPWEQSEEEEQEGDDGEMTGLTRWHLPPCSITHTRQT